MYELNQVLTNAGACVLGSEIRMWNTQAKLHSINVSVHEKRGVILHYENPPVHHIDTRALSAYESALSNIEGRKDELIFLIFSFAPDPVHAGGDLKETLTNLRTKRGFAWADRRLLKAFALYKRVRALARHMRVISILSGGVYYGGSAEIALWADYMLGDSRSSICMSEATIGLIPGWGGFVRLAAKAGYYNAKCLVATARKTTAQELKAIGVLDRVSDALFADAFEMATSKEVASKAPQIELMSTDEIEVEISRRSDPQNYSHLWGRPLAEVRDEIAKLKLPLALQSIRALRALFLAHGVQCDDADLYRTEMKFDAALYRHPLLAEGIEAVLQKRVPNFLGKEERA